MDSKMPTSMRVLVVSDILLFPDFFASDIDVRVCKWEGPLPSFKNDCDAVIVDLTGLDQNGINKYSRQLQSVLSTLPKMIDRNDTIIIIVCGTANYTLTEHTEDEAKEYAEEEVPLYNFLKKLVPKPDRLEFLDEPGDRWLPLPIRYPGVLQYLDGIGSVYVTLHYQSDSKDCRDVYPFAMARQGSEACIAFEHRVRKGVLIILPGYDVVNAAQNAYLSLVRICRNYHKLRAQYDRFVLDVKLPEVVKATYQEALLCYINDLYFASRVVGRSTVEVTLSELGIPCSKTVSPHIGIGDRLRELCGMGVLVKKAKDLGDAIKKAGDTAAHTRDANPINRAIEDERLAREQLEGLKLFLGDIVPIDETKRKIQSYLKEKGEGKWTTSTMTT